MNADTALHAPLRPRTAGHHAGAAVRQRRRTHQRHRLGAVQEADQGRPLRRSGGSRAPAGRERRADPRRQHGRGPDRFRNGDGELPQPDRRRTRHRARAGDGRFVEVDGDRSRPALPAGQRHRQFDLAEGRRSEIFFEHARKVRALRRGRRGDGVRRSRPGRHESAQGGNLHARIQVADRRDRLPAGRHHLRSEHLRHRHRHRGTQQLRRRLHRGHARDQGDAAALPHLRRRVERVVLVPRQRDRCARRSTACSCTTRSRPAWTWASSTPAPLPIYDDLDPELRERVEDVVLNRRADGTERLLEIAERYKGKKGEAAVENHALARAAGARAPVARAGARHRSVRRSRHRRSARSCPRVRST